MFTKRDVFWLTGGWWLVSFKNKQYDLNAPPHYHISLPVNDNAFVVLCIITSKIENRVFYYRDINEKALNSLVFVSPQDIDILNKDSLIDCNQPIYGAKREVWRKYIVEDSFKKIANVNITESLKKEIISAILRSPLVRPSVKQALKF